MILKHCFRAGVATLALTLTSYPMVASSQTETSQPLSIEEEMGAGRSPSLETSALRFVLESANPLPVLSVAGESRVIGYGPDEISLYVNGRLLCLDPPGNDLGDSVRLRVRNANDHPVVDTKMTPESIFAYYPFGLGTPSRDGTTAPTVFADFNRRSWCFYEDDDGIFSLYGMNVGDDGMDFLFADRFAQPVDDVRKLELSYENVSASQIVIGEDIGASARRLDYDLVIRNTGAGHIQSVALQELVPFNRFFYDAIFANVTPNPDFPDNNTSIRCRLPGGGSSTVANCGPTLAQDANFVRGVIDFGQSPLGPDQSFVIEVRNRIASNFSTRGSFLNLTAAAVAVDFEGAGIPAHDVAEANIWLVGLGSWIAASINDPQSGYVVRDLDPDLTGVGITVRSWDSQPDPLRGGEQPQTVPKAGIPVEVSAVEMQCIGTLDSFCTDQEWLNLEGVDTAEGRGWTVPGDIEPIVLVTPAAGVTEFEAPGEDALIDFQAYATRARNFRLNFSVDQDARASSGILDNDGANTSVELSFIAAEPSSLQLPPQVDTQANSCAQVGALVSDAFGNPVAGVTVSVNTDSIVVPADGCNSTPALTGPNGIATLVAGSRLTGAFNLTFSTSPEQGNLASDSTLNVDPGPIHLLRITEFTLRNGCVPDQDNCVIPINETMERLALRVEDQWGNTVNSFDGSLGLGIRAGVNVFGIFAEGAEPSFAGGELTMEAIDIPEIAFIIGSSRRLTASIVTPEGFPRVADTATFEVTKAMPELTLELDPAIGVVGESITATIALSGALDATGVVEISSTSSSADGCTISLPQESCIFTISSSNGPFDITASYSGDTFNAEAEAVIEDYEVILPLALTIDGNNEVLVENEEVYTVSLVNNSVALSDNVEILFEITPPQSGQGARGTADPVELSYCADSESAGAPGDCVWLPLTLTPDNGTLTGRFGPEGGFPVAEGYNASTFIQAVFNQAGTFDVEVSVMSLSQAHGVLAADSITIEAN
ncbi:MAG: Ig-like domain-containing protein [Wenzhouxiangella sp.]|nr:Ig-like domain-containing protein [Wenzhouxiangella sp.]